MGGERGREREKGARERERMRMEEHRQILRPGSLQKKSVSASKLELRLGAK